MTILVAGAARFIGSYYFITSLFDKFLFNAVTNFATDSHFDNFTRPPRGFIEANIIGIFTLLNDSRKYWTSLSGRQKIKFHLSSGFTDDDYGLRKNEKFHEAFGSGLPMTSRMSSSFHHLNIAKKD